MNLLVGVFSSKREFHGSRIALQLQQTTSLLLVILT
jgi:hypothetical protein